MAAAHRRPRSFSRGFTLLELLVVLVIMGLASLVVPPVLSGIGDTLALKGGARQLAAGLRRARSQAVTQQRPVRLMVDLERRQFQLDAGRWIDLPAPGVATVALHTAQSEVLDDQRAGIRFFPDGSATGGHVVLDNGRLAYRVNVDWLTGRVDLQEQAATAQE
ncbi:MAG: GspH/FimT family pseudopilin [Candidatus Competibacterales bacterium]